MVNSMIGSLPVSDRTRALVSLIVTLAVALAMATMGGFEAAAADC